MNIEKCECDRLGYEYRDLLEQVASVLHHIPYAKDYISEERIDKLHNLVLKLATGDCEIIEFKRKLCRYDVTEKIDEQEKNIGILVKVNEEKDKQITQLTNNWNELEECIKKEMADGRSETNLWLMGCYDEDKKILDKMKEIKGKNDNI